MIYNEIMATKKTTVTKTKKYTLTPKEAEIIIKEDFITPLGNKIQKNFIFKPHSPNDATIQFNIKGDRKEVK